MATASSTTSHVVLKPCEIQSCQRMSSAVCHHCDKNVCRRHFIEHADELMQELNQLADSFNELGEKISSFSVKHYKQKAFDELMEWRNEAIQNINNFYEKKKRKLELLFQDNEETFSQRTISHLEVLDTLKNETSAFVKEGEVAFEQLKILKRRLHVLEDSVNQTHSNLVYWDIESLLVDSTFVRLHSAANNYRSGGTLLCTDYRMRLNYFYGNVKQKWKLIYKATEDGFRAEVFHHCSDNKGPTMTIIQAGIGDYLFGGYTKIPWGCDNNYKLDSDAFLFTLKNPHGIQPTKFFKNPNKQNSVGHGKTSGPCFGGVVKDRKHFIDIQISSNANENENSVFSFPSSYIDSTGKGAMLFTGTENFRVKEIEVYVCLEGDEGDSDDEYEGEGENGV